VKVTRELIKDRWVTAVYPFAVSFPAAASTAAAIATLTSFENGTLGFTTGSNEANKPFVMRVTSDAAVSFVNTFGITITNVEVKAAVPEEVTAGKAAMVGTYTATDINSTDDELDYIFSNNTLYPVSTDFEKKATINPYRAYIKITDPDAARALRFTIDGEATAIEGISVAESENGVVYNLQGQRVMSAQKGLYIKDGKKVVRK
jgi:hypothetical protein